MISVTIHASEAEPTGATNIEGCSNVYKSKHSNLLMDVVSNGKKEIEINFLYSGDVPFGFHIHTNPNKLFKIRNNLLSHSKKNKIGQVTFSPKKKFHSFKFVLKNKFSDLDIVRFDNSASANHSFKENIVPIKTDHLRLCSWIRK